MVVGLVTKKGQYLSRCSGALVAPNLVLTARHCIAQSSGGLVTCGQAPLGDAFPPEDSLVTQKYVQSDLPEDYVKVSRIEPAPGGDDTCGFDLAAIVLEGSGLGTGAKTAAPRLDLEVQAGELYTAVGYGSNGSAGVGTRRFKTDVAVSCVGTACAHAPRARERVDRRGRRLLSERLRGVGARRTGPPHRCRVPRSEPVHDAHPGVDVRLEALARGARGGRRVRRWLPDADLGARRAAPGCRRGRRE